jgi:hypothetical protein
VVELAGCGPSSELADPLAMFLEEAGQIGFEPWRREELARTGRVNEGSEIGHQGTS